MHNLLMPKDISPAYSPIIFSPLLEESDPEEEVTVAADQREE